MPFPIRFTDEACLAALLSSQSLRQAAKAAGMSYGTLMYRIRTRVMLQAAGAACRARGREHQGRQLRQFMGKPSRFGHGDCSGQPANWAACDIGYGTAIERIDHVWF